MHTAYNVCVITATKLECEILTHLFVNNYTMIFCTNTRIESSSRSRSRSRKVLSRLMRLLAIPVLYFGLSLPLFANPVAVSQPDAVKGGLARQELARQELAVPLAGQSSYQTTVGTPSRGGRSTNYNINATRPSAGVLNVFGSTGRETFTPSVQGMPVVATGGSVSGGKSYNAAQSTSYSPVSFTIPAPWQSSRGSKAARKNSTDIVNEDLAVMMRADDDDDPFDPGGTGGFDHPGEIGKYPLNGEWLLALLVIGLMMIRKRKALGNFFSTELRS